MTETIEGTVLEYAGTPSLNKALAAVQADLPRIDKGKTAKVPTKNGGEYSYTYADLADVSAQVLPLLGRHGLSFTSWPTLSGNRFVLKYELLHESGESKGGEYPLPTDVNAQALGSAITYARRYCLCAVTGVAPDDDDDAAAAVGRRQVEVAEQRQELDRERQTALDAVRGAWFNQYGEFNSTACLEMFKTWSHGGEMAAAYPQQIRAFAAYLHALPAEDAGSEPNPDQPAETEAVREVAADKRMSRRDSAHMFVLFEKLGMKENRQGQLEYLTAVLGRKIESRGDLLEVDAGAVLNALKDDVDQAQKTGLAPEQPGEGS